MRVLVVGLLLVVLLLAPRPSSAAPKDDAALLHALQDIAAIRERLLHLSRSSSYMQDGRVKLLRYLHRDWPEALRKATAYRKAMKELLETPLRLVMERRLLVSRIEAYRRWGRRTALALPHAYKETMVEIQPILPGVAKTMQSKTNFPRND